MGKLLGLKINNYGSLKQIKMGKLLSDPSGAELGNLIAIIGPSGNGKSTIADAFGFIADCLSTDVETACDANNRGGFDQLVSQGSKEPIRFELYYKDNHKARPVTYELSIAKDKNGRPYVKEERLLQRKSGSQSSPALTFLHLKDSKGFAFEGQDGGQDSKGVDNGVKNDISLSDIRKLGIVTLGAMKEYSRVEALLDFLRSCYLCYFTPASARQMQSSSPTSHLDRTGSNLGDVAQFMYRDDPKGFQRVLSDIQTKLPNITSIKPVKLPNGQMVLEFHQEGFDKPFYSQRMSDGTLKLFAYYLLLHEKNPRQLVFVEEPENGLYHQYMADLAIEMRKSVGSGYSKQWFITTHSPFFVNALLPEQVWVLEKDSSGFTIAKQASSYDFVSDLVEEGAEMGDLWYSRYFG